MASSCFPPPRPQNLPAERKSLTTLKDIWTLRANQRVQIRYCYSPLHILLPAAGDVNTTIARTATPQFVYSVIMNQPLSHQFLHQNYGLVLPADIESMNVVVLDDHGIQHEYRINGGPELMHGTAPLWVNTAFEFMNFDREKEEKWWPQCRLEIRLRELPVWSSLKLANKPCQSKT